TCTLCAICDEYCITGRPISKIILSSKVKLVERKEAPLEIHKKIINGIIEKDNSVNGNPEERLDWLPEKYRSQEQYEKVESDTLLFLGCMSSFRVKKSASASYELLKRANYPFKIIKKEPCCGEYVYSSGDLAKSKEIFRENYKFFKSIGIKRIVATCGGCVYAFQNLYPKYVPEWDIEVKHIVQIVAELEDQGKLSFKNLGEKLTYHDPCRVGRKLNLIEIYDEPRNLLKKVCNDLTTLDNENRIAPCCGSGSGIRGVDSSIAIKIGSQLFKKTKTPEIISSCPLCIFQFRYVNYKTQNNKTCTYITDYLLKAIK
ncbi:MAG: (Fe-S)-binding protein, partial [Promethearchaeota archaeon]